MNRTIRRLGIAAAALAASAALAGQADAATSTVRLHTKADFTRYLTESGSLLAQMAKDDPASLSQRWIKTDVAGTFSTLTNVRMARRTGSGSRGP